MTTTSAEAFYALTASRRGHFRMESGMHGTLWLDLDALFAAPGVHAFTSALARLLAPLSPDVVCGPLLGGAFAAQLVARELSVPFCHTERVATTDPDALFGARYRLPSGYARVVRGKRVALVDDVMSAGSSLRATEQALRDAGATPIAAGALLVLGDTGTRWFESRGIAVVAPARDAYAMHAPDDCPLCASGTPLEDVAS